MGNVKDNNFVLDYLPQTVGEGHKNVAVFTAGWGMKFVPLIGRILKQLVIDEKTEYDISHFKITRKGVLGSLRNSILRTVGSSHHVYVEK